jgi:hypothetical protein
MVDIYDITYPVIRSYGTYYFTTKHGMEYEVRFGRKEHDILRVNIVFGVINDEFDGEEYVVTNKGDVYSVMNTISKIIEHYMETHPAVYLYEFMGEPKTHEDDNKPTQRLKLYYRYAKRIWDEKKWKIVMKGNKVTVIRRDRLSTLPPDVDI